MRRLFIGFVLLATIPVLMGAGGRTHCEMGARCWRNHLAGVDAMLPGMGEFFRDDTLRKAYFQGCVFPDWGYPGANHGAAEDSHWRPFHDAFFAELSKKYPQPWNEEAKRRIAFFLGAITHGVTDIPWHFNHGSRVAFENMAGQRCESGYGNMDMSCDIKSQVDLERLPEMAGNLWFPVDDILPALQKVSTNAPTAEQLETGRAQLTGAATWGCEFGVVFYRFFGNHHPWAHEHYVDYYYGGVENAAAGNASWMRYWYAQFKGWTYLQNAPEYACQPPGYVAPAPCADTSISRVFNAFNMGAEPVLEVGKDGPRDERRILIRFDTTSVSRGTRIKEAKLWMWPLASRGQWTGEKAIEATAFEAGWNPGKGRTSESTGFEGVPAQEGETCWKMACADRATPEDNASGEAQTPAPLDSIKIPYAEKPHGQWVAWNVTRAAQAWVDNPESNFGLMLAERTENGDGTSAGFARFCSSEAFRESDDEFCGGKLHGERPILILIPEN